MRSWLVRDARAHFSEVIDAALKGEPQRVTRRGKGAVVVVSEEEWRRGAKAESTVTFGDVLATFPLSPEEWAEVAPARHTPRADPFSGDE